MKIDEAKSIPITELAEKLGAKFYKRTKPHVTQWFSPLRDEKSPSFYIDEHTNSWKDFGHHLPKGDILDLWIDFHNLRRNDPESTKEALKALEAFDTIPRITVYKEAKAMTYSDVYQIKKLSDRITDRACVDEITRRNLSRAPVTKYLKQADVLCNGKTFKAISFANDKGGHEISTYGQWGGKPFKNCVGPKAISTFTASPAATEVNAFVFNGKFDLATWDDLQGGQKPTEEFICTNGDSMIGEAAAYLISKKDVIKFVYMFPDHDESGAGEIAMHALGSLLEAEDIQFGFSDELYIGFEDLSAYHMRDKKFESTNRGNSPKPNPRLKY